MLQSINGQDLVKLSSHELADYPFFNQANFGRFTRSKSIFLQAVFVKIKDI